MYNESQQITQQEFYSDFQPKSKGGLSRIPNEQFPHTVINIWWKFPKNQWSHHKTRSSLKNICHVQCTNSKERIRHSGTRYLDCKHLTTRHISVFRVPPKKTFPTPEFHEERSPAGHHFTRAFTPSCRIGGQNLQVHVLLSFIETSNFHCYFKLF